MLRTTLLVLLLCWPLPAAARATVGRPAPWFKLVSLYDKTFTNRSLLGRPALLVVATTRKGAPPCKEWMLELIRRHGKRARVFQVVVADNGWWRPRALVRKMLRDFTPRQHHGKVLIEWYTVFSDVWGIPKQDRPVVLMLDAAGKVRWRYRGKMTRVGLQELELSLQQHDR